MWKKVFREQGKKCSFYHIFVSICSSIDIFYLLVKSEEWQEDILQEEYIFQVSATSFQAHASRAHEKLLCALKVFLLSVQCLSLTTTTL